MTAEPPRPAAPTWVPAQACTLPTAEQPLRVAEFDRLFAASLTDVDRLTPVHARLRLRGPTGLSDRVQDLADRETACCSFFTFAVTTEPDPEGESVVLDVRVPGEHAEVLTGLVARTPRSARGRRSK